MAIDTDQSLEKAQSVPALEEAIRRLEDELRAVRAAGVRQRRLRLVFLVLVTMFAIAIWSVEVLPPVAQAQAPLQLAPRSMMTPEERRAQREALLAALPANTRHELQDFERQVDWLTRYMQTWDENTAGAVVALMLYRMSENMNAMPSMEQQMRTMSAQMGALPAIVAELNQMNAKMTVITGTMDSTMGRAGRMVPWMPFFP